MTRLKQAVAGGLALLVTAGVLGVFAPPAALADSAPLTDSAATPTTVTADALPTVQINGVAWSQVVVGTTVYVAGKFSTARPAGAAAGTKETVRNNLLAYDIRTGNLITSFAPDLNAQALVVTASPDGSRIYVGGDFTKANGQTRNRVAAYDTATGALVTTFKPSVTGQVRALAATDATLFIGGSITAVGSVSRTRLAAVTAATGALKSWAPKPGASATKGSNQVMSMVLTNNNTQVVVAGRFATLNGVKATGVGALDPVSGAVRPFAVNTILTNQGANSAVYGLSTDGTAVYGSTYNFSGPGNLEGTFAATADGGALRTVAYCRGDNYSNYATDDVLYIASHMHDCSYIGGYPEMGNAEKGTERVWKYATAVSLEATQTVGGAAGTAWLGKPASSLLPWFPTLTMGSVTGQYQAAWTVTGSGQYVVYGGEFPKVNGTKQQGLVRFAMPSIAPNEVAPTASAGLTPTVTVTGAGAVRVGWTATSDLDNENLTYRVYRDGGSTPVCTVTRASTWWNLPTVACADTGLSAGSHSYRVTATDPMGNSTGSATTTVAVPTSGTTAARAYADAVRADGAIDLWSLGESSGTTVTNGTGLTDLKRASGAGTGAAGALAGDTDKAYSFDGGASAYLSTTTVSDAPRTFSLEAWFKTTSATGGRIIGFGDAATGQSTSYDRLLYLDATGKLKFGVWTGASSAVSSTAAYNDGAWHQAVATIDEGGMTLYVDGKVVGSRTDVTASTTRAKTGNWRIGADKTWSGLASFNGSIDEVAVYPTALSAAQVNAHLKLAKSGVAQNVAPRAAFTSAVGDLSVAVDASASADDDGSIAGYAWTFGDGGTATGATASHTYKAAGTYSVKLTVTDDDGATGVVTRSVTVTAPVPNKAPTAAFTSSVTGLAAAVDASSSEDPDGDVAGYAWTFGDGGTATGPTASHAYATAGTYDVQLTVTDDDGATTSVTRAVTVAAPASSDVIASDTFARTVTGGLGTAEVGGAWTSSAGPTRQSVADGVARLDVSAGQNTGAYLGGVAQVSADIRTTVTVSSAPTSTGTSVYVSGRRVAGAGEYRVRLRFLSDGRVGVVLSRLTGSTEAFPSGEVIVPGLTYTPGTALNVRVQVSGTGTTQVKATVWADGATEPTAATMTRTDTTAALQAPGAVGLGAYLPAAATSGTSVRFSAVTVHAAS